MTDGWDAGRAFSRRFFVLYDYFIILIVSICVAPGEGEKCLKERLNRGRIITQNSARHIVCCPGWRAAGRRCPDTSIRKSISSKLSHSVVL